MAKQVIIFLLALYKLFLSPLLFQVFGTTAICRFNPTCSQYMLQMVKEKGAIKGMRAGLLQLAKCHPFANSYGTAV